MTSDIIVDGLPLMDLEPHRRIRFAIKAPGRIASREGGIDKERLLDWQARAVAIVTEPERKQAEEALATVMRLVNEYVIECNDVGGIDPNDLSWRLAEAGFPLPDDPA